jgi:hypothetical protein
MGNGLALAAILVAIAFTYWRPFKTVRTVLGIDHLVSTGHAFLVLGYFLGLAFGQRPEPLVADLGPVVAFVAGWVGFATGMRFDVRVLRMLPARTFVPALLPALSAALVVGGATALVIHRQGATPRATLASALVLGAAAASSGPTLVAVVRARRAGRSTEVRPVLRMIEFSAGADDLIVVVLAMLAFAVYRPEPAPLAPGWLIAIATGGGALLGGVTWLLLGGRAKEDERLLLGLAMLAFIGGFAGWLYFSPAGVAAVSAIVLVNLPGVRMARLLEAVRRVERPAVIILMTVIGFHLTGALTWALLLLVFAMTALRLLAKRWAGDVASGLQPGALGLRTARHWGDGLVSQGLFGVIVALSFFHVWRDDLSRTVLGAAATASLLNEMLAPWFLLALIRRLTAVPDAPARAIGSEAT